MGKPIDPGRLEFDGVIEQSDAVGAGAWVAVPPDIKAAFGAAGRVPVVATFDGMEYRGSITPMGGRPLLGILKSIRAQLGKGPGDVVHVTLALDDTVRAIVLGADAAAAIAASPRSQAAWDALSYSHQREYHLWIEGAKRAQTREARIAAMVTRLEEGRSLK